jgi:hypothetical protein
MVSLIVYRNGKSRATLVGAFDDAWQTDRVLRGDGATQFGRALTELNIDILCANSPRAKRRVERAWSSIRRVGLTRRFAAALPADWAGGGNEPAEAGERRSA